MRKLLAALTLGLFSMSTAQASNPHDKPKFAIKYSDVLHKIHAQAPTLSVQAGYTAVKAYLCAHKNYGYDPKRLLTIIDYSMPSTAKRMWIIDIANEKVLYNLLVAHGRNSGANYATKFSDIPQSKQSSIGVFVTENTYYGHDGYAMRLKGLDKGFNDAAYNRDVVIHGAKYVSEDFIKKYGRLGRSWGCPALSETYIKPVINLIKEGTLVVSYYPDSQWIKQSTFLNCKIKYGEAH